VALEARVKLLRRGGQRIIPISGFFTGKGEKPNILRPDEMLAEIQIPPPSADSRGAYHKLRIREAIDFPLAAAAVVLNMNGDGVCRKARVVLGAIDPGPMEASKAEEALQGRKIDGGSIEEAAEEAFQAAHPVANLSIDYGYRRRMIRVLLKRAVIQALGQRSE